MRVDSHQHFWQVSRGDYFWMSPAVPILHRDYCPEGLKPSLAKHRIDKTILVQAAPTATSDATRMTRVAHTELFAGRETLTGVKPDPLIRVPRQGFRLFWRWKSKPRGRPWVPGELQQLIAETANDNPTWGQERMAAR